MIIDCPHKIKENRNRKRNGGKNKVVKKFVAEIEECTEAKYIAVVPDNEKENLFKAFGLDIYVVSWKKLCDDKELIKYLEKTIYYNQNENISQILNNPLNS